MPSVLIVENDQAFAATVRQALEAEGFTVHVATEGNAALELMAAHVFAVVVTDVEVGALRGLDLIAVLKQRELKTEVIVVTGFATVEVAASCVREGAFDFLQKPIEPFRVVTAVQRAVERTALQLKKADFDRLAQDEAWYRTLFEFGPTPLMVYDPLTLRYLAVNATAIRLYGYSREEFLAMRVTDIRPPEDIPKLRPVLEFRGAEPKAVGIWRHRKKSGELMDVDVTTQDVHFGGRHARLVTCHNVTARQQTERALVESEANFRALIEQCPDQVWVHRDGVILYVNPSVVRTLGYERADQLIGRSLLDFIPPDEHERARSRLAEEVPVGVALPLREARFLHRGGKPIIVESLLIGIFFNGLPCRVGVARDITERKELEARLSVADRMASVGTLAAGVAHEINNPLAYVLANLSYLVEELQGPSRGENLPEVLDAVRDAQTGVKRVQSIVHDLKSFSRVEEDRREPVDLHRALDSAVNLAWNEVRHRAQLVKRYEPGLPWVDGNDGRFGQVFLNLLVNAAQSIPEGAARQNEITLTTGRTSDGKVFVEVRDTGSGISPEGLRRMFDPFYTTKPKGVGTGLGLPICQGIVAALGGTITVESQLGKGSAFRVVLPPSAGHTERVPVPTPELSTARRGRIMVLDDEPKVGTAIQRTLRKEHDVRVFCRGADALASLRSGEKFDLILCDLMMPELTGLQFYSELEPQDTRRVVFITGGCFSSETLEAVDRLPNLRLEKPVDAKELRRLVRQRLDGAALPTMPLHPS